MRQIIQVLVLCMFCISCKPEIVAKTETSDLIYSNAHEYISRLTSLKKFNGVVFLKKGTKVILKKSYNMTVDQDSTLYVRNDSQFDIRSIAKLFAKVSIIDLEEKGKLKRSDAISKFLPDFPKGHLITIEHLMTNSSGLPREFSNIENTLDLTQEKILSLAAKEKLEFQPGQDQRYSNVGFQLLYYIIGVVHGSTFSDYLKETYFQPLQMKGSGDNFDPDFNDRSLYAYGHYLNDNKELRSVLSFPQDDMKIGNFHSTVEDFSKFLSVLDQKKYLSLQNNGAISHAGGTRGKRAYIERNFEQDYSIIFLANYDAIPFEKLVKDLQSILNGVEVKMPEKVERKSIKLSEKILENYQGTYDLVDAGHILLTIKLEDGILYVYQKGKNNGPILPESESVFFDNVESEESIVFEKNDKGTFDLLMDFQGVRWKGTRLEED